jgi:predicted DsbA family dithiol-disulfide isomerase
MSIKPVVIDVISDVICPWCYLGKYRLDKAIAQVPEANVTIRWRPFFLDPSIPIEGLDRREYLAAKFGEERLQTLHDPLIEAGKEDGVPYQFDKITRTPNTMNAHRLVRWAGLAGNQNAMVSALFDAYWSHGKDIGDIDVLVEIATSVGLNAKRVRNDLNSDLDKLEIFNEVGQAQSMGIQGVPTFVFQQKYGLSGAQSADVLAKGLRRVLED